MRIEIDDKHPFSDRGERGSKIDCGRGFADPAFLIGKHDYAHGGGRHLVPQFLNVYENEVIADGPAVSNWVARHLHYFGTGGRGAVELAFAARISPRMRSARSI